MYNKREGVEYMEKSQAKQAFIRMVVLALASVVVISVCFLLGAETGLTAILSTLLLFAMVFILLFYWVIMFQELLRHVFDKNKEAFDYYYLINFLLITVVTIVYMIFYFQLIGGALIQIFL
jgi:glucan phosphoethanolaminetransferase (alkaline phosphatase superfamily)